ncbi:translation initiation factor IF-2 [Candidatus Gottesmanbacteria bacterium]|nr:translation initiation factor IF-2 [Candidatus Gottesmanbacteria bacterium]
MTGQILQEHASRPPIVAVLGHVDHGKTTLLDTIRKTSVAAGEHGGITQRIGAYQVNLASDTGNHRIKNDQLITFIDTPGHEAFAKMRSRGAEAADIALLVVAADDSVKPQTKESIEQIKTAEIPLIVVVNKIDLPAANVDHVKQDLAKAGVQVEGFGGDVPVALVSAKTGTGVRELLDLILLVAEMKGISGDPQASTEAVVIETRIDHGRGMVASIVIKAGTLHVGMPLYEGPIVLCKVRAMFDESGVVVKEAGPSKPVEVLGFTKLPAVGAVLTGVAGAIAVQKQNSNAEEVAQDAAGAIPDWLKPVDQQEKEKLAIILKADSSGSLEAIIAAFSERIRIVDSGIGDISEADILLAKSTGAFVVGFNVKCPAGVAKLAETEKVVFRTYHIIYELLDELADVVAGMKEVLTRERELGTATVIAEFPFEKQRVAGCRVTSGRIARGDVVKIMRGEAEVSRGKVKSLRLGREDVTKVEKGAECGVLFDKKVDFMLQDAIIPVTTG